MNHNPIPSKAFILAAGKGTRLRPYTDTMPKPMVPIGGTSIIRHTLQKLADQGIGEAIINTHHLGPVLHDHLRDWQRPAIRFSEEPELLETGGGAKHILPHMDNKPFFMINGDAFWEEGPKGPALKRLGDAWDETRMDLLLLLQPVGGMTLTHGVGDYTIGADGRARRSLDQNGDYMFAGVRIVHPRLFEGAPDGPFSFLTLMDKAQAAGRLFALAHDGAWHHISTPDEWKKVDEAVRAQRETEQA